MTDDGLVANDGGSGETNSDLSPSENGEVSSDSSDDSVESLDHDLSDHSRYKNMFNPDMDESRYSGTASENLGGDTQGSFSHGSSDGNLAS